MSRKHRSILSIASVVALTLLTSTGCALLGLEEEEETTDTTTAATLTGSLSDIEGTWVSSCVALGSSYNQITAVFSGTNQTVTDIVYSDNSCNSKRYTMILTYNNLSAGGQSFLTDGTSGYYFFAVAQTATLTPQDSSTLSAFNTGICGITSWQLNQATTVAGLDCETISFQPQGDLNADVYAVSGSSLKLNNRNITLTKQ